MSDYKFNALDQKNKCVNWIREYFDNNGKDCNAVIGISGGKDSTVVAALCAEALGPDKVIGVLMPCGDQQDIEDARLVVNLLGIKSYEINIERSCNAILFGMSTNGISISDDSTINLKPRIRNSILFAISQSCNGRVANTCNLSEDWIGYSTLYGDLAGQFAPLARFTKSEVVEIGKVLFGYNSTYVSNHIIDRLIDKTPSDGLCGKSDEDSFGFTYKELDEYIRTGICTSAVSKKLIDERHNKNLFKCKLLNNGLNAIPIPGYDSGIQIHTIY